MDWANERYVRIYTRDTADDQVLSWQARGLWPLLIRKADRAGVITTNHGPRGIAALVQWPIDVVSAALTELVEDGRVRECSAPRGYVIPNYIQAQETPSSTAQRKREEREARSVLANSSVTKRDQQSQNVTGSHTESHAVTVSHGQSQTVTPYLTVPNRTEPNRTEKRASPPAPQPSLGLEEVRGKVDAATGPHHAAIAEFTGYYQRAHSGASPTWSGKTTKLIGGLVKAHGLHEITRRLAALEATPPTWPPGPWDLATFVQHFDKLAAPASARAASPSTGRAEPQRPEDYEADRGRAF